MIWLTSDYHFCHDREFIWRPRGFSSCEEMCEAIVQRHNAKVSKVDHTYILGDIMLGDDPELGLSYLQRLNGFLHLVRGNHDSNKRWDLYRLYSPVSLSIVEQENAIFLKYKKHTFYLSHYPTITANLEPEHLSQMVINIHGHTHQKTNFYMNAPFIYHCGLDSHNCEPVLLDSIIEEIHEQARHYNPGEMAIHFMQHEKDAAKPDDKEAQTRIFMQDNCLYCKSFHTCHGPFSRAMCSAGIAHNIKFSNIETRDHDGGYYN